MTTARELVVALDGHWHGSYGMALCPAHDDHNPSLNIRDGEDGQILWHCHAGCSQDAVKKKLIADGLLTGEPKTSKSRKPQRHTEQIYDYHGPDGRLLFQVVRIPPKKFRQRRPDGKDGWIWDLNGVERVPYRLPDLLKADAETVYIVEGEKDVDTLARLGLIATCNPGGAGKWREDYKQYFRGRRVIIVPDNDPPGREHAHAVASGLDGKAAQIKVVELPGLKAKGDVSDWIAEGGTGAELRRICAAAPEWQNDIDSDYSGGTSGTGSRVRHNANTGSDELSAIQDNEPPCFKPTAPLVTTRAFLDKRYMRDGDPTFYYFDGAYCRWNGRCYEKVDRNTVRAEVYGFLEDAVRPVPDAGEVPFDPATKTVNDVMDALRAVANLPPNTPVPSWLTEEYIPDVTLPPDELLALSNGLLHLPTLDLHSPTPLLFLFNALDYPYEASAGTRHDRWLRFLSQLWPNDQEAVDTLQEIFGYLLTTDTSQQKIFMIVGPKRSGKGTIARVLTSLLGPANVCAPTLASLSDRFGLAPLIDKQAAIIADARLGMRSDQAAIGERLLSISGEDSITVDRKFLPVWTGRLPTRFLLLTNVLPRFADASGALASRLIILRLTESFYGREDRNLTQSLLNELPGILNWAIEGWKRLRARGHVMQPSSSFELAQELEDLASPIMTFIRECCVLGHHEEVSCDVLYRKYNEWRVRQGLKDLTAKSIFGSELRAVIPGLDVVQHDTNVKKGERFYLGVGLA